MTTANFSYIASDGSYKSGELRLEHYGIAEKHHMRVGQLINKVYPDAHPDFGTAFEQGARSLGIFTKGDPRLGIVPTTVRDIMTGECMENRGAIQLASSPSGGGTIVSPNNPIGGSTPASRVFFPEVVMQMTDMTLRSNYSREMQVFKGMLAMDDTIASEVYTQPVIDTSAPEGVRRTPWAQNTLPRNMVSISSSQTSKSIATEGVGLQISLQAQAHATVDMVGIIVARQFEAELKAKLWEDIASIVSGNLDAGQAAMTPVAGTTYDSAMTGGVITQKGWLKMLWDPQRKLQIDSLIMTMDDFIALQGRTGRPVAVDPRTTGANAGNLGTYGLNVEPVLTNFEVYTPNILLVPDGLWAARHLLAFDSRYFLKRVTNSSASYAATERMVLQQSDVFVWTWGSITHRFFEDAGEVVSYA
jgi:hypothetical protein